MNYLTEMCIFRKMVIHMLGRFKINDGIFILSELKHYSFTKRNLISEAAYLKVHSERATAKKISSISSYQQESRKKIFSIQLEIELKHNILVVLLKCS